MPAPLLKRLSILSTEYVLLPIVEIVSGVETDWTSHTVEVAAVASGTDPAPADWQSATTETDGTVAPPMRMAKLLVGVGTPTVFAAGFYDLWSRVITGSETATRLHGTIEAY